MNEEMQGYKLSDFSKEDISLLVYVIEESMSRNNPLEWMSGYIEGCLIGEVSAYEELQPDESAYPMSDYILLLDIFWSYLHQGGGELTTPGHIGYGFSTTDIFKEIVDHLIDNDLIDMDVLLDFISTNIRS